MSQLNEFRNVFHSVKSVWGRNRKPAIVMITGVNGSAYRLPGTKMMMADDGEMSGSISGGCLESDIFSHVEKALKEERPLLVNYDLSENDIWSLGIGCKGTLEIFILPVHADDRFWNSAETILNQEEEFALILELPAGFNTFITKQGKTEGDNGILPSVVYERALSCLPSQRRAEVMEWESRRFVIDVIRPSPKLIVSGAGKDANPVVELAAKAGFSVAVIDPRRDFNHERNFPCASCLVKQPEEVNPGDVSDAFWVIMNHLQARDEAALRLALNSNPKYIGVLGPVSRTKDMLNNIGADFSVFEKIHSPVGLDIGAETIEEVAISIVSELMKVRSSQSGNSLKGKSNIHG